MKFSRASAAKATAVTFAVAFSAAAVTTKLRSVLLGPPSSGERSAAATEPFAASEPGAGLLRATPSTTETAAASDEGVTLRRRASTSSAVPPNWINHAAPSSSAVASQSSICWGGEASRAIDGNTDGNWGKGSVTHTCDRGSSNWWMVEFGERGYVDRVDVYNREDCCSNRLTGCKIELLDYDESNGELDVVVASFTLPDTTGEVVLEASFDSVAAAAVRILGSGYVSLAEVMVWGEQLDPELEPTPAPTPSTLDVVQTNLALHKDANQSSVCYGGDAKYGVDGVTVDQWGKGRMAHTCYDDDQWWEVDLGGPAVVFDVIVRNRMDCCSYRISDSEVQILNEDGTILAGESLGNMEAIRVRALGFGGVDGAAKVRIANSGRTALNIAEVEVMGAELCPPEDRAERSVRSGPIAVAAVREGGMLCTLSKVATDAETGEVVSIVPLGRSYDFRDWGNAAGEVANGIMGRGWNCHTENGINGSEYRLCKAHLPEIEEDENAEYVLTSYRHSLPERDEVARFLSAATFGTTKEDLDGWDFTVPTGQSMADWAQRQMDPHLSPPSSHRDFWRTRANLQIHMPTSPGRVTNPCYSPSRWRKVSYTKWESKSGNRSVNPVVDSSGSTTKYAISVNGMIRSVVDEADKDANNPPVDFPPGFEDLAPVDVIELPDVNDGDLDMLQSFQGPTGLGYLLYTHVRNLPSPNLCDSGDTPPSSIRDDAPPIVGQLPSGEYVLYDGVLELRDNVLLDPLTDGGGGVASETGGATLCSNVPRTFLNGEFCRLGADDADTCPYGGGEGGGGGGGTPLVCGSPGEVANDVTRNDGDSFQVDSWYRTVNPYWLQNTRRDTWTHVSITAPDQLRQRTAFALSQIFAIVTATAPGVQSEIFSNYYDIFVRNAFGNYRDVLREVAYSPMMADNLSYIRSKSHAYVREHLALLSSADENFAREVMQLFTIGTVLLNPDGTAKRDLKTQQPIEVYDNEDIMNFARAWTGFDYQELRGNIESRNENRIDPARIEPSWRDKFPKRDLDGGYIGDQAYPLCADLPERMFLMKGAKYRFLGGSRLPELMMTNPEYLTDETTVEFELNPLSQLRAALCNGTVLPGCVSQPPQNEIVLTSPLTCTPGTSECDVDTVRVVKVAEGRYWEYIRPPCVEHAFYEGGKKLGLQNSNMRGAVCADPRLPAAMEACCEDPPPSEECEACSDGNPCSEDLCTEADGCLHVPIPGCTNGATLETWNLFTKPTSVSDLTEAFNFPHFPNAVQTLNTTLESPPNRGNSYGARLRAYISPPETGDYTFYIKGDDFGELWLSPSSDPEEVGESIASFSSWKSSFHQHEDQKSDPIYLVQGQLYYLEALHVESGGNDNFAVAWESANKALEVIPASSTQQERVVGQIARMHNLYDDERVTYATAAGRCEVHAETVPHDAQMCDYGLINDIEHPAHKTGYHWTDVPCKVHIKVADDESSFPGWIAIVHNTTSLSGMAHHVDNDSLNFFPAVWDNGQHPRKEDMCGGIDSGCEMLPEEGCLCATSVSESAVFEAMPPSAKHAFRKLFIGAVDPAVSASDVEYETEEDPVTGIIAHKRVGANFDQDTIFEVHQERTGRTFFLKNIASTVHVGPSFSFRNAPHFMSMVPSETVVRDAQYETEAVLDHYFYHKNTAPFLASLFIQRFNIASNPTPAYIKAVATAFQTGWYVMDDGTSVNTSGSDGTNEASFGSGKYGDLAATVACILLHPEARSPTVDADPASGSIRQPLLKVIAMMRNLALKPAWNQSLQMVHRIARTIDWKIGQGPHDYHTVFSHFLADFQSAGRGSSAGLYAPEEMVLDMPNIARLVNGFLGTAYSEGFNSRYGFGQNWSGVLTWRPKSGASGDEVANELATLLTSGRLSSENRAIVANAYSGTSSSTEARRLALQLITSTPEFHTTNIVTKSGKDREAEYTTTNDSDTTEMEYKAVIFLNLQGGADSFNMLVPHTCEGTESNWYGRDYDLYEQYKFVRNGVALDREDLLEINSGSEEQPCSVFGVHPSLSSLTTLYKEEDALFVAGAGHMSEPVNRYDWQKKTVGGLFGHSSMQRNSAKVDPFGLIGGTGVLGRMRDVLNRAGHKTSAISIAENSVSVVGQKGLTSGPVRVDVEGVPEFPSSYAHESFTSQVGALNNATEPNSGFMAEQWSSMLHRTLVVTSELREGLLSKSATTAFPQENDLGDKLEVLSRLQQVAFEEGVTRDFYYVSPNYSFDHHGGLKEPLKESLALVDAALDAYVKEIKLLDLWDSTVLVETSEFGRHMNPNGNMGTDHGWSGNYFMIGGGLKGGRILGEFPSSLLPNGPQRSGGRVIPSTPWDSIWNGVAEWMGISGDSNLDEVCPNRGKFDSQILFNATTMFTSPSSSTS